MANVMQAGLLFSAQSMAASANSLTMELNDNEAIVGVHVTTGSETTTHVGTIYFEVSNDQTNFVSASSKAITSGAAINHFEDMVSIGARYFRVRWERTSGDGALTAIVRSKERS